MHISATPVPAPVAAARAVPAAAAPQPVAPPDVVSLSDEARAALEAPLQRDPPAQLAPWLLDTDLDGDLEVVTRLEARAQLAVVA